MTIEGGCYCKQIRYESDGDALIKIQCFCRECQYLTGGDSLFGMGVPENGFKVTQGKLEQFKRPDIENAITRGFCPNCGTHVTVHSVPGVVVIRVGTLDDPSIFGGPALSVYTCDKQAYHHVPTDIPTFEKRPG